MRSIKAFGVRRLSGALVAIAAAVLPGLAVAWDGQISGVIFELDVTAGDDSGFRVFLPTTSMCGNSMNWAYLNSSDSNYSTYAAALMMAKATGENIVVFSNKDSNGYCHIGYVAFQ
jgi:hypothetical protein